MELKTKHNKKRNKQEKIKEYIKETEKIDEMIDEHYKSKIYRKLNMNIYINTQRSKSRMIKNFKEKIGSKEETIVVIGDNGVKDVVIKGLESTISKKIIEIFKNNHYETYIIDEFRTSCLYNKTEERCENLYQPDKKDVIRKIHSVLTFQMENKRKGCINRDRNAVLNMIKIVNQYLIDKTRPIRYRRDYKVE